MARPASIAASSPCSAAPSRRRPIARMQSQEERHLKTFDQMMVERGVRPTLLQPVWNVAGHALGAVTALMGPNAAMACTAAVETEIDRHYAEQLRALGDEDPDLADTIADSAPRSSSIATRRSPPAPRTRSAIRYCPPSSAPAAVSPSRFRKGSEPMKALLIAAAGAACSRPRPAAAQDRGRRAAEPKINQLIVYGDDPCPPSTDDEIIVCARKPESDRYRIPENLRGDPNDPANQAWANRATELEYVGRTRHRQLLDGRPGRHHRLLQPARPPGPGRAAGRSRSTGTA